MYLIYKYFCIIHKTTIMENSFSFLSNRVYTFPVSTSPSIQGNIAALNSQIARIYFTQSIQNEDNTTTHQDIPTPLNITVIDTTLDELAPQYPPNDNFIILWTSDYEIQYNYQTILKLNMKRQYTCTSLISNTMYLNEAA
jgi:hypothetical protein